MSERVIQRSQLLKRNFLVDNALLVMTSESKSFEDKVEQKQMISNEMILRDKDGRDCCDSRAKESDVIFISDM